MREKERAVRFARRVFILAGIYGILVLVPQLFVEDILTRTIGPVTYPASFYGFIYTALVWQPVFILIGGDPARYRPLMAVAVFEKLAFGVPAAFFYFQDRSPSAVFFFGLIDLAWGTLFALAFWRMNGSDISITPNK